MLKTTVVQLPFVFFSDVARRGVYSVYCVKSTRTHSHTETHQHSWSFDANPAQQVGLYYKTILLDDTVQWFHTIFMILVCVGDFFLPKWSCDIAIF